jgi:hypothetical protein
MRNTLAAQLNHVQLDAALNSVHVVSVLTLVVQQTAFLTVTANLTVTRVGVRNGLPRRLAH